MKRGLAGLTVLILIIGGAAIYLGLEIMAIGEKISNTGGAFGTEMSALGGLWTAMGAVLAFLGMLALPMALGFAAMREWGRKNGAYMVFFIAAICIVAGMLIAYFDVMESIIYFVLTVLALICGQLLREKRRSFELGAGGRKMEAAPTYRETKHVQKNVVVRRSRDAPKVRHRPPVNCPRCGTVNDADRTHCKMCAKEI